MDLPRQYRASEELERFLGDPENPANVMSFHNVMQWDEQEAFPQAAVDELYRFGMNHHYVPVEYGGCFASYEEFQSLARVAARRDLTTAITFSSLIWSTLIWVGGTEQQKRHFAKLLRWTKEAPTLAYSEEQHGADLIANDLRAVKTEGGWRLTGEKWPITRATRSGVMAVLATPGEVGEGRELALRAFQVTRSLCAGLSLGAVDTALRTTLSFAMNRRLYGGSVFDIPMARQVLTDPFVGRRLELFSRGRDDAIQGFGDAVATLHDLCADAHSDEAVLAPLQQLARRCMDELHDFDAEVEAGIAAGLPPHAAAACLQMWLHNRTRLDDFFASGAWLLLALDRLLNQLSPLPESPSQTQRERVAQRLAALFEHGRLFSIVPLALARDEAGALHPSHEKQEECHERQYR